MREQAGDEIRRYVVLPVENAFNAGTATASVQFSASLAAQALDPSQAEELALGEDLPPIRVVEAIELNAGTIVEMNEAQRLRLSAQYPGLQIAPEGVLHLLRLWPYKSELKPARLPSLADAQPLEVSVVDPDGRPIVAADVVIVFNRKTRTGVKGLNTDARGRVSIPLPAKIDAVDLIIVTPFGKFWPVHAEGVKVAAEGPTVIEMAPAAIEPAFDDSLARMCARAAGGDGAGVKIAVIDAGVTAAPGMNVVFGINTTEEADEAWDDNGSGHGTHVAGVIHRMAPDAEFFVYRVLRQDADDAREGAVAKAIRDAVDKGCDLINLSLGQPSEPILMIREIRRARALGTLCIAAAGNGGGAPVEYPARSAYVEAVAACGHMAGWPAGSSRDLEVAQTPAAIGEVYFANFSNCGPEIDFVAPGSGIVSHVSANELGVMSGTSMASPLVTGAIARLLSRDKKLLQRPDRDQQRSDDIAKLGYDAAKGLGFGVRYEGKGLIP